MKKILLIIILTGASFICDAQNCIPSLNYDGCDLEVINFTDYTAFQWYRNGVLIPNATQWSYEPLEAGSYTVKAFTAYGCFGVSKRFKIISWCGIY